MEVGEELKRVAYEIFQRSTRRPMSILEVVVLKARSSRWRKTRFKIIFTDPNHGKISVI